MRFLDACSLDVRRVLAYVGPSLVRRSVGPQITLIYVGRIGLPLMEEKCITEHAHVSYK